MLFLFFCPPPNISAGSGSIGATVVVVGDVGVRVGVVVDEVDDADVVGEEDIEEVVPVAVAASGVVDTAIVFG